MSLHHSVISNPRPVVAGFFMADTESAFQQIAHTGRGHQVDLAPIEPRMTAHSTAYIADSGGMFAEIPVWSLQYHSTFSLRLT